MLDNFFEKLIMSPLPFGMSRMPIERNKTTIRTIRKPRENNFTEPLAEGFLRNNFIFESRGKSHFRKTEFYLKERIHLVNQ